MGLDARDVEYIRGKRRIYLLLFVLALLSSLAANFYHPAFFLLQVGFLIAFLTQFIPAARRADYSIGVIILLVVVMLIPLPLFGLGALVIIGLMDHNMYKSVKNASFRA